MAGETRIAALGKLYDKAIENVKTRLEKSDTEIGRETESGHNRDMSVIQTYLNETRT